MDDHVTNRKQENNELDFFGLRSSKDLYKEIRKNFIDFYSAPDDTRFLLLIFTLNHLREWIAESNWEKIKEKRRRNESLTDGEKFFEDIWEMPEFRVINSLCNRGKHYITKSQHNKTNTVQGFSAGLGRCGDSLGQLYYLIDGVDVRDILSKVVLKYDSWFNEKKDNNSMQ